MTLPFKMPSPGLVLWSGTFPGAVKPLPRPRKAAGGHMYQPLENQRHLRAWMYGEAPKIPYRCDIWLAVYFFFCDHRRADGDNLLKSVMDGLQYTRFVTNDAQVVGGIWSRGEDEFDYTHIFLHEVDYNDPSLLSDISDRSDLKLTE